MVTSLKVPEDVKEELNKYRYDKEAYHVVIKRLIEENKELKADKELLSNILSNISVANSDVKVYTEIINFIVNGSSEDKLQELKNYFSDKILVEPIEVKEAVENVKKQYVNNDVPSVLVEFEAYIKEVD